MSHVPPDNGPDWGVIGGILAALATLIGTSVAAMKGVFQTKSKDSNDRVGMSFDNIFKLVNELQAEVARKDQQIKDQEDRCAARALTLEHRIATQETTIAIQVRMVSDLERQIVGLKQGRRE